MNDKHEIEIPGLPEGWKAVAYRRTMVAKDRNHAWEVAHNLCSRLNKITSGDYNYVGKVELI